MKQPYLECGKIINTHGVRGAVKAESYCDTPGILASLPQLFLKKNGIYEAYKVVKASVGSGKVLLFLDGVDDLDKAMLIKGKTQGCFGDEVAIGFIYHHDAGKLL